MDQPGFTARAIIIATSLVLVVGCGSSNGEEQITNPLPELYLIERGSGNEQVAPAGTALPDSIFVIGPADVVGPVFDGVPFTIVWTVTSGGGSVAEATTQIYPRDEEPRSGNVWTLGPEPGIQSLRAELDFGASPPVTFLAIATD
jgi:hypothetical protein